MGKVLLTFGILLLFAIPNQADTFEVSGSTFNAALEGFPATNYVDWVIQGQLTGPNATDNFYADLPPIFQLFGIAPQDAGLGVDAIHSVCSPGVGSVMGIDFCNEQLLYATTLPLGFSAGGNFNLPAPTATPEPTTLLLTGTGLLGLAFVRKKYLGRNTN